MDVGFVGLGSMGAPMAANLVAAGHHVVVWNRTASKADALVEAGAVRGSVADAVATGTLLSMFADDAALREQVLEAGVLSAAPEGAVHAAMGTHSVPFTRAAAEQHDAAGVAYVAAPVLGRADVAEAGELNILVSGPTDARERLQPLFDVMGKRTWPFGDDPAGAAIVKIINNFLLVNAIEALAEGLALGTRHGVEPRDLVELFSNSTFPGPVYGGYGAKLAARDYGAVGFRLPLGLKDVGLALAAGQDANVPLPLAGVLRDALIEALAHGAEDQDLAVLGEVARRRAGLD